MPKGTVTYVQGTRILIEQISHEIQSASFNADILY